MLSDTETANPFPGDAETVLANGDFRLRVSSWGASLRGLWREGIRGEGKSLPSLGTATRGEAQAQIGAARREIVTGYEGAKHKVGGQGDVLIPFAGRIGGGRYAFGGETYQMPVNDKEGPNAIHGFLRGKTWEIAEQSAQAVTFAVALGPRDAPGYPFPLQATVEYVAEADGMTCRFAVTNTGNDPAPVAAGFHPYFSVGGLINDALLTLPFASVLEFDDALLPTGNILPVENGSFDFRAPRRIEKTIFNTCFLQPDRDADGLVRIRLDGGDKTPAVTVWMDEAFGYVVVYSGDPLPPSHRRRALAIEPMTGASDVFNHPDWGLRILAPGETLAGAWGVKEERKKKEG